MVAPDPRQDAFFDLSGRTRLRLTGNDRIRFLNGQITNAISKATPSAAIAACILNAKGRLNAHLFVSAPENGFLLDAAAEVREALPARLERYVIADDVQIEDESDQFSLFHVLGQAAPDLSPGGAILSVNRFGHPGFDIWKPASERNELFDELSRSLPFYDAVRAETFRIEQGIPRWGRELIEEINPLEANLEESCIDYEKGCYIGQEVISRMKMSGQRNKALSGMISIDGSPLAPGMKLYSMGAEKKEAGWITSSAASERLGKQVALGYVKRPFNRTGVQLDAREDSTGSTVYPGGSFGPAFRLNRRLIPVMAKVTVKNVSKIYPGDKGRETTAVSDVSLTIEDREFAVLVGPSGCGKSTTLRMIAGLEEVSKGEIYIGDRLVNDVAPKDRDIAMVFQNYALYPHMSVYDNLAFGLKLRRYPKAEIKKRVRDAAGILGIEELLDRKPKALSGGQRQRVAVGRAIVRQPKVFLFDEPLSNLDAKMRVQMRAEISKLHQRLQATMIYVTHDQVEAMTMGDRIVVMNQGLVQQVDTPLALYHQPANLFVAGFLGSPPMNFVSGSLKEEGDFLVFSEIEGGAIEVRLSARGACCCPALCGVSGPAGDSPGRY